MRHTPRPGPCGPRRTSWYRAALLVWAPLVLAACTDGTVDPRTQPGTVTATLTSPNGPEGAALIEVALPVSTAPVAGQLFSTVDGPATRILVVMDEAGTIRFDLDLPDIRTQLEYTILQVSGPDDELRADLSGYTLELTP